MIFIQNENVQSKYWYVWSDKRKKKRFLKHIFSLVILQFNISIFKTRNGRERTQLYGSNGLRCESVQTFRFWRFCPNRLLTVRLSRIKFVGKYTGCERKIEMYECTNWKADIFNEKKKERD